MALEVEDVVDGSMHAEKALRRARRLEPLHFALASSLVEGSGFEASVPRKPDTDVRMWISASKRPSLLTSSAIGR